MAAKNKKKFFINNEKGQALFEFVIFLPFLIFIFTAFINISSSINGSINQQKATRGYLFRLLLNDSKAPNRHNINFFNRNGINVIGMSSVGWRIKSVGESQSFGACYKFLTLFGSGDGEECDDTRIGETQSNFIKVFTFYGVCANTYMKSKNGFFEETHFFRNGLFSNEVGSDQCVLK